MELYYHSELSSETLHLTKEEARHIVKVLRYKEGQPIQLTDGKGIKAQGVISKLSPKDCTITINHSEKQNHLRNYQLAIGISPTKNDSRFEWFLEKATEIGIDEIIPIKSDHSLKSKIKKERFSKILISAMKQSAQCFLPNLKPIISFNKLVEDNNYDLKLICHCHSDSLKSLKELDLKDKKVLLLIGPEGDFSNSEVEFAISKGFIEITLGQTRLRTETAGIIACSQIALLNS